VTHSSPCIYPVLHRILYHLYVRVARMGQKTYMYIDGFGREAWREDMGG